MTKDDKLWAKVEAAYRAGMSIKDIRAKYKVAMGDLLNRIKDGGWTRAASAAKKAEQPAVPENLPAVIPPAVISAEIKREIEAEIVDVIKSHKLMSRQLREQFEGDLAEYQAFSVLFKAFDEQTLAELVRKVPLGQPNPEAHKYLQESLDAYLERTKLGARNVAVARQVIDLERTVWGLDKEDSDGAEKEQSYDDALDEFAKPLPPIAALPANVVAFENRIKKAK